MRNNEDLLARRRRGCTTGFILDPGLSWTQSGHHKGKLSKRVWGISSAFLGTQGRKKLNFEKVGSTCVFSPAHKSRRPPEMLLFLGMVLITFKTAQVVLISIMLLSPTMTITWNLVKWNAFNLKADRPYWNEEGTKTAGEN